jgi:amphi-Trp domain-containing protein
MEQEKLKLKQRMSLEELVIYLEDLSRTIRQGKLVVSLGDEFVILEPGQEFQVAVKAKQEGERGKVSISFSWPPELSGEGSADEEELSITAEEPPSA